MKKPLLLGMTILVLPCAYPLQAANPALEDTFTLKGERTSGSPLKGTITEIGEGQWAATADLVISAEGNLKTTTQEAQTATVELPPGNSALTVEVDINPEGSAWTGVALLSGAPLSEFWTNSRILVNIHPSGKYEVLVGSESVAVGTVDAFSPGEVAHLTLTYNPTNNGITYTVNQQEVLKDHLLPDSPTITHLGLRIHDPKMSEVTTIDNLRVTR